MTLDWLMGIAGFLLIVSIFANRISDRFGIPGLLLFLGIGMLAGTDGVGKILFVCAYYLIGLSFEVALLLSVIVSSTDAPAVFAIMRTSGMHLKTGLKPILEFESGSNDPMAVLLSMGAITI